MGNNNEPELTLQPLETSDQKSLDFFIDLYISAFPKEERRPIDLQINLCDKRENLLADLIIIDHKPVGFITYWPIKEIVYIEHFAISSSQRGGGLGSKTIKALNEKMGKGILLEVEPPSTEEAKRRIDFYQRMGFILHPKIDYSQPSYGPCLPSIPMLLMTLNIDNFIEHHKSIIQELSHKVYNTIINK